MAPVNASGLGVIEGLTYSDNWYVTHLIQFGIVGMAIFVFNIILVTFYSLKHHQYKVISLLIVLLFYSGAENVMFLPGVLISWVFWVVIFTNLKIKE
ncbi:hypothetical protein PCCS19_42220 [Paenibacillus sp. CCS19]|nr:hypothetical protein PCCS19_42220 [Paenibacillus cellulosilyticus]